MKKMKMYLMTAMLGVASLTMVFTSCNNDECKDVTCVNGGTCNSTDGSCTCPAGYEGTTCQILSISKYLGTNDATASYSFADIGSASCGGTFTGVMTVSKNSTDATKLNIANLGGFGATTSVTATVNGTNLTIANQPVTGATNITITGSGVYNSGSITGTYSTTDATGTCTYNFTWTKQ